MRTNIGREEVRLGAALADSGLVTLPQHRVAIGDPVWGASAYVDLAAPPLAIEVYSWWREPWMNERQYDRAEFLIRAGWVVCYLWLRNKATFTDGCVDALLKCHSEVVAGPVHNTYRVIDHDGGPAALGWLSGEGLTVTEGPFPDPVRDAPQVKCCFPHRFNSEPLDPSPPAVSLRKRHMVHFERLDAPPAVNPPRRPTVYMMRLDAPPAVSLPRRPAVYMMRLDLD